jgi:serine protease Do
MKAGDVVLKVSGKDVTRDQTLSFLVANTAPGTTIPVEVLRGGQTVKLNVVVGKRPSEEELAQQTFDRRQKTNDSPFQQAPKGSGLAERRWASRCCRSTRRSRASSACRKIPRAS